MAWNSVWPDGSKSVRANTAPGNANTAYIENTMNVDHFWNDGTNNDGRHQFVQSPAFTDSMSNPINPTLGTGMAGAVYYRTVSATDGTIQGFYKNVNNNYQFTPGFKDSQVILSSSYSTVTDVPDRSYGLIYMWIDDANANMAVGFFRATSGVVQTFTMVTELQGGSSPKANVKFGNGSEASGLNIRAKTQDASGGTYVYRLLYWGIDQISP